MSEKWPKEIVLFKPAGELSPAWLMPHEAKRVAYAPFEQETYVPLSELREAEDALANLRTSMREMANELFQEGDPILTAQDLLACADRERP